MVVCHKCSGTVSSRNFEFHALYYSISINHLSSIQTTVRDSAPHYSINYNLITYLWSTSTTVVRVGMRSCALSPLCTATAHRHGPRSRQAPGPVGGDQG